MADYARRLGYTGPLVLEDASTTTWENIANITALVERFDALKIVSDPLHAERARAYLWHQRPDIASRLVRAGDFRLGERGPWRVRDAMAGLREVREADRTYPPPVRGAHR